MNYEGVPAIHQSTADAVGSMTAWRINAGKWQISYGVSDGVEEISQAYEPFVLETLPREGYAYSNEGGYARSIYDSGKFAGEWNDFLADEAERLAMNAAMRDMLYHDGSNGVIESAAKFSTKPEASWVADQMIAHVSRTASDPYVGVGVARVEKADGTETNYYVYVVVDIKKR